MKPCSTQITQSPSFRPCDGHRPSGQTWSRASDEPPKGQLAFHGLPSSPPTLGTSRAGAWPHLPSPAASDLLPFPPPPCRDTPAARPTHHPIHPLSLASPRAMPGVKFPEPSPLGANEQSCLGLPLLEGPPLPTLALLPCFSQRVMSWMQGTGSHSCLGSARPPLPPPWG